MQVPLAAAFNTPLAGIVFAIEEMGRAYEARTNGLVLTAVILAGLASLGLLGNYTYFGIARDTVAFARDWPLVLSCGIIGGCIGASFSLLALKIMRRIRRWNALQPLRRTLAVAGICGLAVASALHRAALPLAPATRRRGEPSKERLYRCSSSTGVLLRREVLRRANVDGIRDSGRYLRAVTRCRRGPWQRAGAHFRR